MTATILVLATGLIYQGFGYRAFAAGSTKVTPYTVKLKHTLLDGKGKILPLQAIMMVAVRSDGSRAIVNEVTRVEGTEVERSVQPASGGHSDVGDRGISKPLGPVPGPTSRNGIAIPTSNAL